MVHTTLGINIRPAHENRTFHSGQGLQVSPFYVFGFWVFHSKFLFFRVFEVCEDENAGNNQEVLMKIEDFSRSAVGVFASGLSGFC